MPPLSILTALDRQRGHLFPWVAVLYAAGIAIYFGLRVEPEMPHWSGIAAIAMVCATLSRFAGDATRLFLAAILVALAGFVTAGVRAHQVADVTLAWRYYGPVEGRVVEIDRSVSDAVRLTLDRVRLARVPPERTPGRVRIALHGQQGFVTPEPGQTVILTANLSPPGGAVEPGGYDFRRQAWFDGLGAVGYTRTPLLLLHEPERGGPSLALYRLRMRISASVQAALPGRVGAFASAITTGDRAGLDRPTLDALRASNLAHLLAISGLHMGLLTGFVFGALRLMLAAIPGAALRLPAKKIAALGALAAGAVYLALSGGNVATERAFVMVAMMFAAILVDRRAITIRAVAMAAIIVLALRPEALAGPGFQMSFAATIALVAVYGALRGRVWSGPRWASWAGGVVLSSFIAGMTTAPVAAAHFNQVPHYGLLANVVSVPLMGLVVMPAAVLAAILWPFGLSSLGLALMKPAILWVLGVAETVAGWPGALTFVVSPPAAVLPLLALGGLWIVLWQGPGRLLGLPALVAAAALWSMADRPVALVSETGGLVGVMTDRGRALSKARGDGFAAESWLENDGDGAVQAEAAERPAFRTEGRLRRFEVGGGTILHATGKVAAAEALAVCGEVALVVVNIRADAPPGCEVYDARRLSITGALAIDAEEGGPSVTSAREWTGDRLWSRRPQ